jgi:hypothetical protein
MGLRDTLKHLTSIISAPDAGDGILEPLLASQGIEAGQVAYDPITSQVVLALRISGQTRFTCIPTGRTFTRAEICRLIAGRSQDAPAPIAGQADQANAPPNSR